MGCLLHNETLPPAPLALLRRAPSPLRPAPPAPPPPPPSVLPQVLATVLPPAIPAKYSPELQILLNRMMQVGWVGVVVVCVWVWGGGGWVGGGGGGGAREQRCH